MILNSGASLDGCQNKILTLIDIIDSYAKKKGTEIIVTSAKRNGEGKSWHDQGLAVDFCFKNSHIFKHVSELYLQALSQQGAWQGVTEFEVCCNASKQHIHIAKGNEPKLETFTGIYK